MESPTRPKPRGTRFEGVAPRHSVLVALGLITAFALAGYVSQQKASRGAKSREISKIKNLLLACHSYSHDQPDGNFPPTLESLVPEYFDQVLTWDNPLTQDSETEPFGYQRPSAKSTKEFPVIYSPQYTVRPKETRLVGYLSGVVTEMKEERFQKLGFEQTD